MGVVFALLVAGCGQLVMSVGGAPVTVFDETPTTDECEQETDGSCLDANRLRERYGLDRLAANGLTGKGVTVAVIDFSGAESVAEDLEEYSSRMGLPPPDLRVRDVELGYEPFVEYDSSNQRVVDAAVQTTRQVQLIHTIAPQATILVERLRFPAAEDVNRPVDELLAIRLRSLVNERAADVVMLGNGLPEHALSERTDRGVDVLLNRRPVFQDAARHGVTVVAPGGTEAFWPGVDPGVLTVGGSAGASRIFELPSYQVNQSSLESEDDERRWLPDLSLPATRDETQLIFQSVSDRTGWMPVRVTEAERMAGLLALSAQAAGGTLGQVNDDVYYLATETANPEANGLRATKATPGEPGRREVVDVDRFVRALADSARRPERSVPDERPKPVERCQQDESIAVSIRDRENTRLTPRVCVRYDPTKDKLTGRITVSWEPLKGAEDSTGATSERFEGFEIRAVLERSERDQQERVCSIADELNDSSSGDASCAVSISSPDPGAWTADGRLAWNQVDHQGGWEPTEKLQGSPVLDVE